MNGVPEARAASEARVARFTIYTCDRGETLSKSFALDDGRLIKVGSGGVMTAGDAFVETVGNLTELAAVLEQMGPRNAISWGVPGRGTGVQTGDEFRVVVARRAPDDGEVAGRRMFARTRQNFEYSAGAPGVFMIDIDDPAPGKPRPSTPEDVANLLRAAVPELGRVEMLVVPSGSACIHDAETGAELRGKTGWRAYALVADASTIPQLGQLLFDALWFVGEGYVKVSESGAKLLRAAADAAVWQPERLDFVGGAQLGEGLTQHRPAPVLVPPVKGMEVWPMLDVSRVKPLTEEERAEVEEMQTEAMREAEAEAVAKRAASVRRQVDRHVIRIEKREKRAVPPAEQSDIERRVRERLERRTDTLYTDDALEVRTHEGSWEHVAVAEIVAGGGRYVGCRARDPYDPSDIADRPDGDGTILRPADNVFVFHSHAHGQSTTYKLVPHQEGENVISLKVAALAKKLREAMGDEAFERSVAEATAWRRPAEMDARVELSRSDPEAWAIELGCEGLEGWERMNMMVDNLAARYAHFPAGASREEIVDMLTPAQFALTPLKRVYNAQAMRLDVSVDGEKEKLVKVHPVDVFLSLPTATLDDITAGRPRGRVTVAGYRFWPVQKTLIVDRGEVYLNPYRPPTFTDEPAVPAEEWFEEFLAYLVPDPDDRDWLRNWIACLVQRPELRGAGVLLVDTVGGSGKTVLIKMLRAVVGTAWCGKLSRDKLMSSAGQGQFLDELVNRVLVVVEEVVATGASYDERERGYARVKDIVDPDAQRQTLTRKGLSSIDGEVFYSTIMTTNHRDALPLPKVDRRIAVIGCTEQPFRRVDPDTNELVVRRPDIAEMLDRVLPSGHPMPAAVAKGLHQYLLGLEIDTERFRVAPFNAAKAAMVEQTEGEVPGVIRAYLATLPEGQTCFWFDDLVKYGKCKLADQPEIKRHFAHNARKVLSNGGDFEGWARNGTAVRLTREDGSSWTAKGVVVRQDVQDSLTPQERYRWLGEGAGEEGRKKVAALLKGKRQAE
jgi:hypothetical protein